MGNSSASCDCNIAGISRDVELSWSEGIRESLTALGGGPSTARVNSPKPHARLGEEVCLTEARNAKYSDANLARTLSLCGRKTVSLLLTCFHRKPLPPTYISRFTVDGGRARQAADDDNKASCSPTSPDHLRSLLTCLPFPSIALVEDRSRSIEHRPYRHEKKQHPRREDTKSLAARAHSTNAVPPWAVETRRSHPRFARPCHHLHVPESRYPSIPPSFTPHTLNRRPSHIITPGSMALGLDTPRHAKL